MSKFRKKPVVIEAVLFTGDIRDPELISFVDGAGVCAVDDYEDTHLEIPTLEGKMRANKGDWIIRGVKGELYPCKPDIFEATYVAVEEGVVV